MKKYDAFPEPIGGYTVGRTQMDFEYTASDHTKRELTAFVYYPSDSSEGKTTSAYMFPEVCEMLDEQPLLTALKDAYSIDIKTQCYDDLALSGKEKRYPVLFYVCRDDDRFACGTGLDSGAFGLQGSDLKKPFLLLFSEPNYNMNAIIGANNSMDTYYFSVDRAAHLDYCDIVFTSVNEELRGEGCHGDAKSCYRLYEELF